MTIEGVTPAKLEAIKTKLQALLAKATDGATSREEAEAYLAKVAELLEKYSISEEELRRTSGAEREQIEYWSFEVDTTGNYGKPRMNMLHSVAVAMGARGFYYQVKGQGYRGKLTLTLFAQSSVLEQLKVLLPLVELHAVRLSKQVALDAARKARNYPLSHSPKQAAFFARSGFLEGFGIGVAERIEARREVTLQAASEGYALVVQDREAQVVAWRDAHHGDGRSQRSRKTDYDALAAGVQAGRAFASDAVTSTSGTRALT